MTSELDGMRVAILATDGFEQVELKASHQALVAAGAIVEIISPASDRIQGMNHNDKGEMITVDRQLGQANPGFYNALVLPGGIANPDALRANHHAVAFVRSFASAGKPIAAICHGLGTLIDAGAVEGHTITARPSQKIDLSNAGARWVDRDVVADHGLVTSRDTDSLPAFCAKMVEEFAEGRRANA